MRKLCTLLLIASFALLAFSAVSCSKKYGDEKGQTLCPVMGNPIDKNIFVNYKGNKVYFCCKGCIEKFQSEPDKYMNKLKGVKLDGAPPVVGGPGDNMEKGHEGHNH